MLGIKNHVVISAQPVTQILIMTRWSHSTSSNKQINQTKWFPNENDYDSNYEEAGPSKFH